MNFWDASAFIEAFNSASPHQARCLGMLRQKIRQAASALIIPEAISALTRRNRQNPAQAATLDRRATEEMDRFLIHEISTEVIEASAEIARRHGLKGADAVHLATAVLMARDLGRRGFVFVTLDKELGAAARRHGLRVIGA